MLTIIMLYLAGSFVAGGLLMWSGLYIPGSKDSYYGIREASWLCIIWWVLAIDLVVKWSKKLVSKAKELL